MKSIITTLFLAMAMIITYGIVNYYDRKSLKKCKIYSVARLNKAATCCDYLWACVIKLGLYLFLFSLNFLLLIADTKSLDH